MVELGRHAVRSPEYATLRLDVREGEFDFAIDTTRSDQSGVERLDLVCGHDDLDVATSVKAIKLVEAFQHGSLDLAFTAGRGLVPSRIEFSALEVWEEENKWIPFGANGIDLVYEDNAL
jgi:hypothetical protein